MTDDEKDDGKYIYVVEAIINGRLEIVGVANLKVHAKKMIGKRLGIATRLTLNKRYKDGIKNNPVTKYHEPEVEEDDNL